jgi:DNA polymerase
MGAKYLNLGVKGKSALTNVKGMNLQMIKAAGLYDQYVAYALDDVEFCAGIFKQLVVSNEFPLMELPILDMIMRMATQPNFVLGQDTLYTHLRTVLQAKEQTLAMVGSDNTAIRQDETFANMLRAQGVEPPRKISPTTGLERYAFAKTDAEFLELEEHENPMVQALVAARLGAKSTIEETRTQRFINISNLSWPLTSAGYNLAMPMPLKFSGAHTHRLGGDWKMNVQNMPRGGELRKSLRAPPGHKVITWIVRRSKQD